MGGSSLFCSLLLLFHELLNYSIRPRLMYEGSDFKITLRYCDNSCVLFIFPMSMVIICNYYQITADNCSNISLQNHNSNITSSQHHILTHSCHQFQQLTLKFFDWHLQTRLGNSNSFQLTEMICNDL